MVSKVTIEDQLISKRKREQKNCFNTIMKKDLRKREQKNCIDTIIEEDLQKKDNGRLWPALHEVPHSSVTDKNKEEFFIFTRSRKMSKEKKNCAEQNLIEFLETTLRLFEIKPENVTITSIINAMPCDECMGILKNNIGKKFKHWHILYEEETFSEFVEKYPQ